MLDVVHGSHLYGLAHPGSDVDRFVVLRRRPVVFAGEPVSQARREWIGQEILGDHDTTVVEFGTFVAYASAGAHQHVEAMCAQGPVVLADRLVAYRCSFRVAYAAARSKYVGAVATFAGLPTRTRPRVAEPTVKQRRHALRLAFNLRQLAATGRCTPTLPVDVARSLTLLAGADRRTFLSALRTLCPEPMLDADAAQITGAVARPGEDRE